MAKLGLERGVGTRLSPWGKAAAVGDVFRNPGMGKRFG